LKGFSIAGFGCGENKEIRTKLIKEIVELLPNDKPRFLSGIGFPLDILEAIELGIDMFHSKYSNFRLLIAAVILHKLHIWDWGFILQSISQKHQKGQCLLISKMGNTNWTKIHCCRIVNASVAKTTLEDTFIIFGTQRSYYSIYWLHCKLNLLLILQGTTLGITRDF
jgi:hypothetical protein